MKGGGGQIGDKSPTARTGDDDGPHATPGKGSLQSLGPPPLPQALEGSGPLEQTHATKPPP